MPEYMLRQVCWKTWKKACALDGVQIDQVHAVLRQVVSLPNTLLHASSLFFPDSLRVDVLSYSSGFQKRLQFLIIILSSIAVH